jgi:hypothetical protein
MECLDYAGRTWEPFHVTIVYLLLLEAWSINGGALSILKK